MPHLGENGVLWCIRHWLLFSSMNGKYTSPHCSLSHCNHPNPTSISFVPQMKQKRGITPCIVHCSLTLLIFSSIFLSVKFQIKFGATTNHTTTVIQHLKPLRLKMLLFCLIHIQILFLQIFDEKAYRYHHQLCNIFQAY